MDDEAKPSVGAGFGDGRPRLIENKILSLNGIGFDNVASAWIDKLIEIVGEGDESASVYSNVGCADVGNFGGDFESVGKSGVELNPLFDVEIGVPKITIFPSGFSF